MRDFLARNNTLMLPQPPYSADLVPCDIFFNPQLKIDQIKTASKTLKFFFFFDLGLLVSLSDMTRSGVDRVVFVEIPHSKPLLNRSELRVCSKILN